MGDSTNQDATSAAGASVEERKLASDIAFRELELEISGREQDRKDQELELRRKELAASQWRSPLIIAIFAAALAALGNAGVALVNGILARNLEDRKAEAGRILEMIKTGDRDDAAKNLQFLLDAGLIADPATRASLDNFLNTREPGQGPALPAPSPVRLNYIACLGGKVRVGAPSNTSVSVVEDSNNCRISIDGADVGDNELKCKNNNAAVYFPRSLAASVTEAAGFCFIEVR